MPFSQQLLMMLTLMLTSKGVAAVPRASLVILAGTLATFGLPLEGVALLLGVDTLMDMAPDVGEPAWQLPGHRGGGALGRRRFIGGLAVGTTIRASFDVDARRMRRHLSISLGSSVCNVDECKAMLTGIKHACLSKMAQGRTNLRYNDSLAVYLAQATRAEPIIHVRRTRAVITPTIKMMWLASFRPRKSFNDSMDHIPQVDSNSLKSMRDLVTSFLVWRKLAGRADTGFNSTAA